MNQDFLIPATPGMARNVLRLESVCKIKLDPDIYDYAEQDLVTPEEFDAMAPMRVGIQHAIQAVIDNNFRAVIPGKKGLDQLIAMAALKIKKIEPIVVLTDNVLHWKTIAKEEGYILDENFFVVSVRSIGKADKKIFNKNRHGAMLVSVMNFGQAKVRSFTEVLSRTFPRLLITAHGVELKNMKDMASALSPGCPTEVLEPNRNVMFKHHLQIRGFSSFEPKELAFLCGIVMDAEYLDLSGWEDDVDAEVDDKWVAVEGTLEVLDDYEYDTEILLF